MVGVARFDVILVRLDPTVGSEIRKTRPCVVISPNEMNQALHTLVVAPMTTRGRPYSWRVPLTFADRAGRIALDQMRTIDEQRIVRRLGELQPISAQRLLETIGEMFAPAP